MTDDLRERLDRSLGARYAIGDLVGRGGMGAVFQATDRRHELDPSTSRVMQTARISYYERAFDRSQRELMEARPEERSTRAWIVWNAETARAILDSLERIRGTSAANLAAGFAALGDKQRALDLIDRAVTLHDVFVVDFKVDPFLDPLRSEPRYQAVLRRLNLAA